MDCESVGLVLHEFVDGMLSEHDRAAVEEHVASCSSCEEHLRELRALDEAMHDLGEVEPPAAMMWEALSRRIADEATTTDEATVTGEPVETEQVLSWLDRLIDPIIAHWRIFGPTMVTAVVLLGFWVPFVFEPGSPTALFVNCTDLGQQIDEMGSKAQLSIMADAFEVATREARWAMIDEEFSEGRDSSLSLFDYSFDENSGTVDDTIRGLD